LTTTYFHFRAIFTPPSPPDISPTDVTFVVINTNTDNNTNSSQPTIENLHVNAMNPLNLTPAVGVAKSYQKQSMGMGSVLNNMNYSYSNSGNAIESGDATSQPTIPIWVVACFGTGGGLVVVAVGWGLARFFQKRIRKHKKLENLAGKGKPRIKDNMNNINPETRDTLAFPKINSRSHVKNYMINQAVRSTRKAPNFNANVVPKENWAFDEEENIGNSCSNYTQRRVEKKFRSNLGTISEH
ncbi:hypothetical protein HK096_009939, partial [Nowakowskiella sp. JEL0078]